MTVNISGVFLRRGDDETADAEQRIKNLQAESWKDWPNEAGFEGLEEHRGPVDLAVVGQIPSWAAGTLYRVGPGQFSVETETRGRFDVSHWFDGFAHAHKFDIIAVEGEAGPGVMIRYSSRRQSEKFVEGIRKRGWQDSVSFAQRADPCIGIFAKMQSAFSPNPPQNNSVAIDRNVNVPGSKKSPSARSNKATSTIETLYMTTDSNVLHEVDANTLEPIRFTDQKILNPKLKGPLGAAHAQRDPETGELFNFNLAFGAAAVYRVYRTDPVTGRTDILATIKDLPPAYIHSMFLTQNYVVLCVPVAHFAWSGIQIAVKGSLADGLAPFNSSKKMQWVVIDRRGTKGVVAKFTTSAGFFFHTVNAFEEAGKDETGNATTDLNFDVVMHDNLDTIKGHYMDVLLDRDGATKKFWRESLKHGSGSIRLSRFRYRMSSDKAKVMKATTAEEILSIPAPHHGELPTINPEYATRRHRFVYGTISRGLSTMFDCLVKTDTATREALIWAPETGHTPGEPIFIPRPESATKAGEGQREEDDGVILSVVLDGLLKKSYLVCLDAKTMKEVGRAECEFAIAHGLHGSYAR